jgi:hypothetical protein
MLRDVGIMYYFTFFSSINQRKEREVPSCIVQLIDEYYCNYK